jgi:hypothetical protein
VLNPQLVTYRLKADRTHRRVSEES